MIAYYNENDKAAAAWLRELIKENLIAPGEVDDRSIAEVQPQDLKGFTQAHFFAGVGTWSYALRLAGVPDDFPVWTGSCPCQPFSVASKRKGIDDDRHLWPEFFRLIRECKPDTVFGEQVASKDALSWLDIVSTDLEGQGYAVGAVDTCAAGVGAPHIRQRLYFVAHAESQLDRSGDTGTRWRSESSDRSDTGLVADSLRSGRSQRWSESGNGQAPCGGASGELGDSNPARSQERGVSGATGVGSGEGGFAARPSRLDGRSLVIPTSEQVGLPRRAWVSGEAANILGNASGERCGETGASVERSEEWNSGTSFWSECDWLPCIDGKARPVEPGTFPLAYRSPARVVRLRGYGNAIVPQVAQAFIEAFMETLDA